METISVLDVVLMVLLTIGVTWMGHRLGGAIESRGSFFQAGSSLPWWAVSSSIVATVVSSVTFISVPAAVFRDGGNLAYVQVILGLMLGKLVTAWLFAEPYYKSTGVSTTYDYIGARIDHRVGSLSMYIGLVLTAINTAVKLLTSALVLTVITGWELATCCAVIVAVSILWSWLAGIKTVIWTDFLLFIIFSIGAIFAVVWISVGLDLSLAEAFTQLDAHAKLALFDFSADPTVTYTIWAGIIGSVTLSLALATSQGTLQRVRACRSAEDARRAYNFSALFYFVHFCILGVGLAMWLHYQVNSLDAAVVQQLESEPDRIFPYFIVTEIPTGLSGLFIAAIFAAGISTLDSAITEVADISVNNIYERFLNPGQSEAHYLRMSRILLLIWGGVFFALAVFFSRFQAEGLLNLTFKLPNYLFGALFGTAILARFQIGTLATVLPGLLAACLAVWAMNYYSVSFFWWCPVSGVLMMLTTISLTRLFGKLKPEMTGVVQ